MGNVRAIRGATTADQNSKDAIVDASVELLTELINANNLGDADVISAFFTTTPDLNAQFPAVAARKIGWVNVALMCAHEIAVPDGQKRCIRVMIYINSDRSVDQVKNIYLKETINLRLHGFEESN
jgi:chorismate mutase|tara:strand:+ start:149 stop:523 length:375 start_codon:yes stop_codon:yes gene_type:complete